MGTATASPTSAFRSHGLRTAASMLIKWTDGSGRRPSATSAAAHPDRAPWPNGAGGPTRPACGLAPPAHRSVLRMRRRCALLARRRVRAPWSIWLPGDQSGKARPDVQPKATGADATQATGASNFGRGEDAVDGDRLDIELHDSDQLAEIDALADLMLACTVHDGSLATHDVDRVLGLEPD